MSLFLQLLLTQSLLILSECYSTLSSEQEWISSILNQTTKNTPHTDMRNNTVYLNVDLYHLLGIDEKEGTLNVKLWLYVTYYLEHIAWDPTVNGIYFIDLPPYTLWTPDIVPFDETDIIYQNFDRQSITFAGLVVAKSSTVNVKLTCDIHVKYFPYDKQVCSYF